ncbi:MAG: NifB/NifX family molybdenum-iron cluster-binding protein [bacterium]
MLVCIPSQGKAGLDDQVSEHFGSSPYFSLYDTTTDELTVLENRNAHHSHGTCHPMNQLAGQHIDAVACSGMGRRAIEALSVEGIKVYQSRPGTVAEVVEAMKQQDLPLMDPAKACRGHGQKGGCRPELSAEPKDRLTEGRGSGFGRGGQIRQGGQGKGRGR